MATSTVKIENSFEVAAPPEAAWALLMDVPRVIPSSSAALAETVDEGPLEKEPRGSSWGRSRSISTRT